MFCKNCGNQVADGASFCANCGMPVEESAPGFKPASLESKPASVPAYSYVSAPAPVPQVDSGSVLTFGILALVFANTFLLSFLGIVFGVIAMNKANTYCACGYPLEGKAKVGRILGKVGMILGIVMTVLFVLYLIMFVSMFAYY